MERQIKVTLEPVFITEDELGCTWEQFDALDDEKQGALILWAINNLNKKEGDEMYDYVETEEIEG